MQKAIYVLLFSYTSISTISQLSALQTVKYKYMNFYFYYLWLRRFVVALLVFHQCALNICVNICLFTLLYKHKTELAC